MNDRSEFAPAKVNLFLHVGPAGDDGYHPISSLMAFADVGDVVHLSAADRMAFTIGGPFADGLVADASNLVVRARDAALAGDGAPFHLHLEKNLPLASGLGGGSADAAAVLRLLRGAAGRSVNDERRIADALGSDIAACVLSEPVLASGRGETLSPVPAMPDVPAVLVNPGVASPTAEVYRAYDASGPADEVSEAPLPPMITPADVAEEMRRRRNDLQAPAIRLRPEIADAVELLGRDPDCLLARMSGSGATCFALAADAAAAGAITGRIRTLRPNWWICATTLRGTP